MRLYKIKSEPESVVGKQVKVILPGHYSCSRGFRMECSHKLVVYGVVSQVKTCGYNTFIHVDLNHPVTDTYSGKTYTLYPVMISSDNDISSKLIFM